MAVIYVCDRCEDRVRDQNALASVVLRSPSKISTKHDLCPTCIRQLETWLSTPPPQAVKATRDGS
jgi:hypothetical protein